MAQVYRNARNQDRAREVKRGALVGEAGEIFTPAAVVKDFLNDPTVAKAIQSGEAILEPAAGDGNFVIPLLKKLLPPKLCAKKNTALAIAQLERVYAIELLDDNVAHLRERVIKELSALLPHVARETLEEFTATHLLQGSYLSGRACDRNCSLSCTVCAPLALPKRYGLIIGNPPYNPQAIYVDFTKRALKEARTVAFVLPTTWKVTPRYAAFRAAVIPHLVSITDLPWKTFAIKLRTCRAVFTSKRRGFFSLNNRKSHSSAREDFRVANSILEKAFEQWKLTLADFQKGVYPYSIGIGWKCNLEKDTGRINYLQSIGYDASELPNNVHYFSFPSEEERHAFVEYSASKLAAYLQYLVDSDSVARYLPLPPLTEASYDDAHLYSLLALTEEEVAEVERFALFISARAKNFYDRADVTVRSDALVGAPRRACSLCGSSSFHRKGCANSTLKEKSLRDGV